MSHPDGFACLILAVTLSFPLLSPPFLAPLLSHRPPLISVTFVPLSTSTCTPTSNSTGHGVQPDAVTVRDAARCVGGHSVGLAGRQHEEVRRAAAPVGIR